VGAPEPEGRRGISEDKFSYFFGGCYYTGMKRIIFDIALFLSIFIMPWWITIPLAIVGLFLFKNFYEFIFIGAMMYAIFRVPSPRIIASPFWYGLIMVILFFGIQKLKKIIILYRV